MSFLEIAGRGLLLLIGTSVPWLYFHLGCGLRPAEACHATGVLLAHAGAFAVLLLAACWHAHAFKRALGQQGEAP